MGGRRLDVTVVEPRPGSILGTRVQRVEDPAFLTTGGVYTEDIVDDRLTDAVRLTFVRSPMAHAKIISIDATTARAAEGCVAVITAADLAGVPAQGPTLPMYPAAMAQPLLATEVVRYVGEPVAAVVTDSRYGGEDVAELVEVDYEPLPVLVDPKAAVSGEVLLFPQHGSNVVMSSDAGNTDIFGDCEVTVSAEILNQRVAVAPLEVRAAAAAWGDDGRLTAWIPNQGAQDTRAALAGRLGLAAKDVHIITPAVGGAFGGKFARTSSTLSCAGQPAISAVRRRGWRRARRT
jgi:carbon-monoxide dehydrogenase large subunit